MSYPADLLNDVICRRDGIQSHSRPTAPNPDQPAFVSDADMANEIQLGLLDSGVHRDSGDATGGPSTSAQPDSDAFAQAVEKLSQAADKLAKSNSICILS